LACRSRVAQPAAPASAPPDDAGDALARGDTAAAEEVAEDAAGEEADEEDDEEDEADEADEAAGGADDDVPDEHPAAAATTAPAATAPLSRSMNAAEPNITNHPF
jgi:hypothetical protein